MRKSYEKAWKSRECPSSPGFPGILGKARKARRKFSTLSGLFLMCKNHRSFWQEGFLALPGSSLILGFPGKPRKSRENVPRFPSFSLRAKKAWIELLTGMISSTLGSSLILGFLGKAKRKYSMPSRLFPFKKAWNPCRLFKTWWSFHLILGFPSFPAFSLHVKNPGNFWLRMISSCHGSSTFRKAWKAKLGGVYSFMESSGVCLIWLDCNMPWLYRIVNENFVQ